MSNAEVRYQVYVKVAVGSQKDFKLAFDFSGDPKQPVIIRCSRDLSKDDAKRVEDLATNFVGNIAPIVFKIQ